MIQPLDQIVSMYHQTDHSNIIMHLQIPPLSQFDGVHVWLKLIWYHITKILWYQVVTGAWGQCEAYSHCVLSPATSTGPRFSTVAIDKIFIPTTY